MTTLKEKLQLLHWLCSDEYEKTLGGVMHPGFAEDLAGVCTIARKRFPFLNQGYFGDYESLKRDSLNLWGVDVQEIDLPDDLLGAYVPERNGIKPVIVINKRRSKLFYLTTLAHELSHVPACDYYHHQDDHESRDIRVRNRVTLFAEALTDKEEILADVLTTLGAYPLPDFKRLFGKAKFGVKSVVKSLFHLTRHYPELIPAFLRGKDFLLNLALLIHFLRLRFFLYRNFDM